jgi:hypothetical protein
MVEHLRRHTSYLGPKQSGVKVLYEETLGHAMPYDDVFQMTVSDRLARYLSVIVKVKMGSRPRFVHRETGSSYLVPTFGDLKEAFGLMETGGSNIRPYLVEMYNLVFYPLYAIETAPRTDSSKFGNTVLKEPHKGIRVQEIIECAKELLHRTISNKDMHHKYLTPMADLGLINSVKSEIRGNEKIYYPADEEAERVHSLFPDSDLRLKITDKSLYPSKDVLEQSYSLSSKLLSEHTGKNEKNISDIYRLEDHEGNEITISELIDRYLPNPELCFNRHGR